MSEEMDEVRRITEQVESMTERAMTDPDCRVGLEVRIDQFRRTDIPPITAVRIGIMEAIAKRVCGDQWNWQVLPAMDGKVHFVLGTKNRPPPPDFYNTLREDGL